MQGWDFSRRHQQAQGRAGESVLHICSPLFFLSHTDRPSLGWLNFIIGKKQYVWQKNSNSELRLVLCRWYSVHSLDSRRDCSSLTTHHNEGRKERCGVPSCVLVSAGISNAPLTADILTHTRFIWRQPHHQGRTPASHREQNPGGVIRSQGETMGLETGDLE